MEEAIDALGSDLSIRLSRREAIPALSSVRRGQPREQGLSNSELARRLDIHERVIRRILDPGHATKSEDP